MSDHKIYRYVFRKTFQLFSLLVTVSVLCFLLMKYSPIDPVQSYVGADMMRLSPEQYDQIADYWGFHESTFSQFKKWVFSLVKGDLGTSLIYRTSVSSIIMERFLASIFLMGSAWIFSGILGFFLGGIAGTFRNRWIDRIIKGFCFILNATPPFWFGLILLIVFAVWFKLFPFGLGTPVGMLSQDVSLLKRIHHMILPMLTLSIIGIPNVALHTRQKLIDTYESEYVWFARSRGEKGFSLFVKHCLKNALFPAISIHFASFGELFGGTILAEQVFSYPGLGQAVVQAGLGGDVPLLLGIALFSTLFVFVGNSIADFFYRAIDPRIRKGDFS